MTIIILTKNEEQNLEKCISSLYGVVKRVVIIGSYSTEEIVALVHKLGLEVYEY